MDGIFRCKKVLPEIITLVHLNNLAAAAFNVNGFYIYKSVSDLFMGARKDSCKGGSGNFHDLCRFSMGKFFQVSESNSLELINGEADAVLTL